MDAPQSAMEFEFLWKSDPLDSDEKVKDSTPLHGSWGAVVEEEPRYIRSINLEAGIILPVVTTLKLRRGYIVRGVSDYLLCEIDGHKDAEEVTFTLVGIQRTIEEADAWIHNDSE